MTDYVTPGSSPNPPPQSIPATIQSNVVLHRWTELLKRSTELHKRYQYRLQLQSELIERIQQRNQLIDEYKSKQQYIDIMRQYEQIVNEQSNHISERSESIHIVNNELLSSRKHILDSNINTVTTQIKPNLQYTAYTIQNKLNELVQLKHNVNLLQQQKCYILVREIYTVQPSKLLLNNIIHTHGIYSIRQYKLPVNRLYTFQSKHVDTALYYTAHLTTLLSNYLNIALLYPITLCGCNSKISDIEPHNTPNNTATTSKSIILPLHITNTRDIQQFENACMLLLRNIQHLCLTYLPSNIWNELQQSNNNTSTPMLHYLFVLMRYILVTS